MRKLKKFLCLFLVIIAVLFSASCEENCNSELDPETFDDFADEVFKLLIGQDELTCNYYFENRENFGLEAYEPSLPTPGLTTATNKLVINYTLGSIERYDYNKLNDDQQKVYLIIQDLVDDINKKSTEMGYLSNNYLGSYLGYQAQLPLLLAEYHFRTKTDVENYLKFLDLVPETFKSYVDFEIEKADNGYGMPDFVIDKVISQCNDFINSVSGGEHFMIRTINKKIDECQFLTIEEKNSFKAQNAEKVNTKLVDGYNYVRVELPKLKGRATNNLGLAHYVTKDGVEIGKEYYQLDFQDTVGYDITVDEAILYIENIITECETKIAYYQNLAQTSETFRNELANYNLMSTTPEAQLEYYSTAFDAYFPPLNTRPAISVKYIDEAMEDHFSPAAYMTSAIDNLTEEYIYLNNASIRNDDGTLDFDYLYTTLAHEGYPGHLYQNVYFKNLDVNPIRKVLKSSGYTEGWATYTELFSYELLRGKYSDDLVNYLILVDEYNGALHSRMDMGVHYNGWNLNEFKTFVSKINPNITDAAAQAAFEQLIEIPNNYQTYFFTYFKLKDLREEAMNRAGSNFDYVEFHKYILDCGPLPLQYVEEFVLANYE